MYGNSQDRNDYDVSASQTAQENFNTIAAQLEAALSRRETDVRNAMAAYQADGVSDQYAAVEAQWNTAGTEIRGIITALKTSLEQNDEIAIAALNRAASLIPGA
jgi:hypothetical protein